jgi:hypothetical protein
MKKEVKVERLPLFQCGSRSPLNAHEAYLTKADRYVFFARIL